MISITGKILRDKTDNLRRNYESFVISVVEKTKYSECSRHIHISNYAANARSSAHKMTVQEYTTSEKALSASADLIKRKLARDRVEIDSFAKSFTSVSELMDFIYDKKLRLTVVQLATIKNDIVSFIETSKEKDDLIDAKSKAEHFEASIERQLSEDELLAAEERSGFGKSTKLANSKWGSF